MLKHDSMLPYVIATLICHKHVFGGNKRTSNWSGYNFVLDDKPIAFEFWAKRRDPKGAQPDSYQFTDGSKYCDNKGIIRYVPAPNEDVSVLKEANWE